MGDVRLKGAFGQRMRFVKRNVSVSKQKLIIWCFSVLNKLLVVFFLHLRCYWALKVFKKDKWYFESYWDFSFSSNIIKSCFTSNFVLEEIAILLYWFSSEAICNLLMHFDHWRVCALYNNSFQAHPFKNKILLSTAVVLSFYLSFL